MIKKKYTLYQKPRIKKTSKLVVNLETIRLLGTGADTGMATLGDPVCPSNRPPC